MLVSERGVPAAHVLQGRAGGVWLLPGRSHVHGLRREPCRSQLRGTSAATAHIQGTPLP